ncbi:MAG: hypothetical protein HC888_11645 [Candidatus Competibacteraceae bacterium]|nr:hypothetical protein [Candidatus Competibacteraceae bacterium]
MVPNIITAPPTIRPWIPKAAVSRGLLRERETEMRGDGPVMGARSTAAYQIALDTSAMESRRLSQDALAPTNPMPGVESAPCSSASQPSARISLWVLRSRDGRFRCARRREIGADVDVAVVDVDRHFQLRQPLFQISALCRVAAQRQRTLIGIYRASRCPSESSS